MRIELNPYITQVSPNGNKFRVSGIRLIKRSWNSYETHVMIRKESGDFQILILDKKQNHRQVFKYPSVEYEKLYGEF